MALTIRSDSKGVEIINRVWPFPWRLPLTFVLFVACCLADFRLANGLRVDSPSENYVAPVVLCVLFSVTCVLLALACTWLLFGREVAVITEPIVELRNELGPWSWKGEFAVTGIGTIHVTPPAQQAWHTARHDALGPGAFRHGEIEFDHDAKQYRFGFDLRWEEQLLVLKAIAEVLPQQTLVPTARPRRAPLFRWWENRGQ